MIEITIPGFKQLSFQHLVLDYNGTIALDGRLVKGVEQRLKTLSQQMKIHVLTADTFGTVGRSLSQVPCQVTVIPLENQAEAKGEYLRNLGPEHCVAVGNGRNDRLMLKEAALGIAVVLGEGVSPEALFSGDVVCRDILDALDLLLFPLRLTATLRS
ncbi:MAG: ATPase P [Deltaproteobacteria bacterium]|nr:ATPase P [Deltaproteobacteria bacterium]